ncbi:MAG: polysaccharide pyruvyl transferase family protein, partial [Bacteroidaceae bacterium]
YGNERFNGINLIHREEKKYHKSYCLLPQTVGPFSSPTIKVKAVKAIEDADIVMTRDKQSFDYVREIAPLQKQVEEYIDVAFFLPYKKKEFSKDKIHVGLNISALLWHGGYTRDNQFGLVVDYPSLVRQVIDYFLSLKDVQLHLIPHVVGGERGIENDYAVSYDLCEEYDNPNITLSPLFLDPAAAKSYISGMDFFMGARMHATIAAFSSGVPVVPMAYSRKFNGLFIDTLDYPHLVDLKVDRPEDTLTKIKDGFAHRDALRKEIKSQNETIVDERKNLLIENLKSFFHIS